MEHNALWLEKEDSCYKPELCLDSESSLLPAQGRDLIDLDYVQNRSTGLISLVIYFSILPHRVDFKGQKV